MSSLNWLVGTDDDPGLLDNYTVRTYSQGGNEVVFTHCDRCNNIQMVARNLDLDQTGLTLGEMVESALRHESEEHGWGASE